MEDIVSKNIKELSFGVLSTEDIKNISVLEITNVEILDHLDNAASGGLHDLRLGPNDHNDVCETCGREDFFCSGHSGHITLPVPVYNPFIFQELYKLLRGTCFKCHRLLAPTIALRLAYFQLQALDYGLVSTVQDLQEVITEEVTDASKEEATHEILIKLEEKFKEAVKESQSCNQSQWPVKSVVELRKKIVHEFSKAYLMKASGKCNHCGSPKKKLMRYNTRLVYRDDVNTVGRASSSSDFANKDLMPEDARKHLQLLWENDKDFLSHFYKFLQFNDSNPIDVFFMNAILVPPSRFRRLNVMKNKKYPDQQTALLNEILKSGILIKKIMRKIAKMELTVADEEIISKSTGKNLNEKFNNAYHQLQRNVNALFDSESIKSKNKTTQGIKQILEKKEGLFRMNMMGKRVNYAARSVISPDPYIMVEEIGIPLVFAKKLTFPEPVTFHNVENLRRAVMNGPDVHPGALIVEMEDGRAYRLTSDAVKRQAIANTLLTPLNSAMKHIGKGKIVHRHIKNGDMVILNRQPTLHRPSMMAHKARILPGEKTLRLHYSNCKSYNADFDGDEMNCHLPQSYLAQGECSKIASVNHQYLVPKDGTPLGGLIQDHIIAGVLLTMRGRFFQKHQYQQLVWSAMSFYRKRLKILPPAILKPQILWSGKQIVSTIILNLIPEGKIPLSLQGKTKVSQKGFSKKTSCLTNLVCPSLTLTQELSIYFLGPCWSKLGFLV
ncbi:DNA-directed RNA polymerase I subunit RPA1 [Caerostris extrusa]|uniref:DNA-directed RNA polymerase subunit n=1 Tax=Caerostris extrusa TaxID=172846 RepID=A0AAV4X482_CAEEX|nr:DNA-directed RNA polymerase I subunit RPA1 [Caerostris extrusa]